MIDTRRARLSLALALLVASVLACVGRDAPRPVEAAAAAQAAPVVISVVGTNDLHGRVERVAALAGHVENLRAVRRADGGAVLLVDAGDLFQGTLESNLGEGAAVIEAYNAVGYTAAAVGNHEFDFGPEGEAVTASVGEDPRGALKARARQAGFPLLAANVIDTGTGRPVAWDNVHPSVLVDAGPVQAGIIGVTTEDTPRTTLSANFRGLAVRSLAETIEAEASRLRNRGAAVVIVLAHAGGRCDACHDPHDLSSCRPDEEIFEVARALPRGIVDVIVAGHTHASVAHEVNGIAVIESFALGRAFGRVDVVVDPVERRAAETRIHPPRELCAAPDAPIRECAPGPYEGRPVRVDEGVLAGIRPALERAEAYRHRPLGVELVGSVRRAYTTESALGNLFADLMRHARPGVDVAITNGGGLRADLPGGPLTYGSLFEAMPFDNRFAIVRMTGRDLERVLAANLSKGKGILLVSGVRAVAACQGATLEVTLHREGGGEILDDERLEIATSDFLAAGGDGAFGVLDLAPEAVQLEDLLIREAMAAQLSKRGGRIDPSDPALFDEDKPRVHYPGERPVRCGG